MPRLAWTCSRAATTPYVWRACSWADGREPRLLRCPGPEGRARQLAGHPEVDAARIGAIGLCLGGSIVLTWACIVNRLAAIAPFHGAAPKPRKAIRRMCPVVGSWPDKDFTTKGRRSARDRADRRWHPARHEGLPGGQARLLQ